ncbi:hypothetical protein L3X38_022102 [Prunus dulcis]|uniref:Uncharacterized protein n=1 Tax=Prunus dulcis TaxID=3755 RepID=A0AAD4Z400_PRUDU|nr:hypothetical protein L3X38_022102 [Prunus dulcis]
MEASSSSLSLSAAIERHRVTETEFSNSQTWIVTWCGGDYGSISLSASGAFPATNRKKASPNQALLSGAPQTWHFLLLVQAEA